MNWEFRSIGRAILEFFVLTGLTLMVTLLGLIDAYVINFDLFPFLPDWLQTEQSEWSSTQLLQHALILISAILFWRVALRYTEMRGFAVLIAGFFACMFIRELDGLLDIIVHGFWVYPALATAAISIAYAALCHGTILVPLALFTETRSYTFILLGIIIVIPLSQTFGSGQLFWRDVLNDDYRHEFKRVMQEGMELFGYIFITYGSLLFQREPLPLRKSPAIEK